jgi:hypothetical protein
LLNTFEASICAAACEGPKTARPVALNASASPSANGTSGPTIVKSMACSFAKATRPERLQPIAHCSL